jgi:hypothetical protein
VGVNLNGGFHDAGDHVKFGITQGYSAGVLGWALYEMKSTFDSAGVTTKLLSELKYFTDYFLASYSSGTFYYQVGEGTDDHNYWGPPEQQSLTRPTYASASSSKPATDVLGQTSAALSMMYLNYKSIDSAYASRCLSLARTLFSMAKSNLGYGDGQSFYQSSSYYDDLSWAAVWLYIIDGTASLITDIDSYLSNATKNGDQPLVKNHWTMCWDDMGLAVLAKLTMLTGDTKYKTVVEENMDYWMSSLTKTPGGLRYLNNWGVIRYAAAEAMVMILYSKYNGNQALYTFAKSQVDYAIGTNPKNFSYIIGIGSNYCLHPSHRAANGYTYANGDNQKPAQHLLTGGLVGGPDQSDNFIDDVNQYQYTEVAIDYNAGFVGALAAMLSGSPGTAPPTPAATPDATPPVGDTPVPIATPAPTAGGLLGDANSSGAIDIVDALLVAQYYVGLNPANFNTANADVNASGSIDIVDALRIAQFYVGLISGF